MSYQPAIAKVGKLTIVNMSLALSCKLVEVSAVIRTALLQNQAHESVVCALALNPTFSVVPIESPRCGGLQSQRRTYCFALLQKTACLSICRHKFNWHWFSYSK